MRVRRFHPQGRKRFYTDARLPPAPAQMARQASSSDRWSLLASRCPAVATVTMFGTKARASATALSSPAKKITPHAVIAGPQSFDAEFTDENTVETLVNHLLRRIRMTQRSVYQSGHSMLPDVQISVKTPVIRGKISRRATPQGA